MKTHIKSFILILFIVLSSCSTIGRTEKLAKKYRHYGTVELELSTYLRYNYSFPESLTELIRFITINDEIFGQEGNILHSFGENFIEEFGTGKPRFVSYRDSCFFFDYRYRFGVCMYGTQKDYINNPFDSRRYDSSVQPSFMTSSKKIIPGKEKEFNETLNALCRLYSHYETKALCDMSFNYKLTDVNMDGIISNVDTIAYKRIFRYIADERLECISSCLSPLDSVIYSPFISDLSDTVSEFAKNNHIHQIIFPITMMSK